MLRQRVITALLLLAALLSAVFLLPTQGWWVVCAVVAAAAGWEWAGIGKVQAHLRWGYGLLVGFAVGAFAALESKPLDAIVFTISAMFWMVFIPPWLRQRWALSTGVIQLLVGLVLIAPLGLAMARLREIDPWLMLAVMAVVWVADIAAYFGGRAFGRRKLAPEISPGKSWEGVYSGIVGVLLYACVLFSTFLAAIPDRLGWLVALLLVLVLGVLSVVGDLFESLMKRQAGIKDSSALLPGHGGILDRIDSLTSTLPLAALWALIWQLSL
ncbi:phosphatidate cytidylyltransferase [Niveibacterium sp. 24ML]|uniref:phosphatidate cytidylyltransferase n=1 Tax=Niveibacterium sp. 24ML TaxID=2985512 RepID=UPI00226DB3E3|nr:phosphatidate cytidylyltransferase [Niveibacterium sp. 24ML]MCX9156560.1 phosphatidate cytidylyltransferase [Niveibacterium sp. 24ML]